MTDMTDTTDLLTIDGLTVDLAVEGERRVVLRDVSFGIGQGESVGLVGESGSGKSMTARAIARLLPNAAHQTGRIMFDGRDVSGFDGPELRSYRERVAVIFQDPRVHINPVRRIGDFMTEALRDRRGVNRREIADRAVSCSTRSVSPTDVAVWISTRTSCPAVCCSG